jgi:hypothetical protein
MIVGKTVKVVDETAAMNAAERSESGLNPGLASSFSGSSAWMGRAKHNPSSAVANAELIKVIIS